MKNMATCVSNLNTLTLTKLQEIRKKAAELLGKLSLKFENVLSEISMKVLCEAIGRDTQAVCAFHPSYPKTEPPHIGSKAGNNFCE